MSDLYMYLNYEAEKKRQKELFALLEEITHRLIACEQSMRRISAQIEEHLNKGGVK
tara:strand:- start:1294 stop:1461 length:168 start_codon:yes stop_codon:yes gene_type:complete